MSEKPKRPHQAASGEDHTAYHHAWQAWLKNHPDDTEEDAAPPDLTPVDPTAVDQAAADPTESTSRHSRRSRSSD